MRVHKPFFFVSKIDQENVQRAMGKFFDYGSVWYILINNLFCSFYAKHW